MTKKELSQIYYLNREVKMWQKCPTSPVGKEYHKIKKGFNHE